VAPRAATGQSESVPVISADVSTALARYARRFHQVAGTEHHVASPLGAWLLLALAAPACVGADRRELEEILGAETGTAAAVGAELLARPHPLVHTAAAVWGGADQPTGGPVAAWLAGLPPQVDTGPVPGQADLDAWARRHTLGLIDRFPLQDGSLTWLLATALAARVSWERPFDLTPGAALGRDSPWAATLTRVLVTPRAPWARPAPGHDPFIAATNSAGTVAVHAAAARGGLLVVSVIAAPDAPAGDVIAAAYELGPALAAGHPVARRPLFDLPLGDGPAWTITEEFVQTAAAGGREEVCTAALPAWSARSAHPLTDPGLGFATVRRALDPVDPWDARQAAMARYTRTGFEAGAVTAMGIAISAIAARPGLRRTAQLRFGHPFAVVAVAADDAADSRHPAPRGPWHGLPVFSAWITSPEDATGEPDNTS
jgi:hypothetical protein